MRVRLQVEIKGEVIREFECPYHMRNEIAEKLKGLYPGKNVEVCYYLPSKITEKWKAE